ncbi:MAG: phage tail tape measure protein [Carnobacterium sp.]|uniref:phage tail tape measure protein n=1 Tax=Carnobacterium sp. TaxID=48221 RepID=UPI003C757457
MSGKLGHIAATASLNIDPFQQSTRVLATQIRSLDRSLKAQETAFKNNGKSINNMKASYTQTGKSVEAYSALLTKQKKKYDDLKTGIGDMSKASDAQKSQLLSAEAAMNGTAGKLEALTGKYNDLGKAIAIQESKWTKVGTSMQAVGDKAKKVGDSLTSFGTKWTVGVTAPIVAGVAASVKAAIDFESAFAGVKKTVDEVVDSNGNVVVSYADLEKGIRGMARELPATAVEISNVAEAAGQLGIKTENVLSFSKTMIDLGESTNMGATEAATALARFANITGMSQDKFSNLGSSIVDLGNNFATTESDIVAMSLRLAGAGSQIGMSEADILGLATALSSVGIEAEMGGSAISKTLINMSVASKTGFEAMQQLEKSTGMTRRELELLSNHKGAAFKELAIDLGMTTTEMKNVMKAGKDLEGFATIAGMTGEQFKKAFEEDAAGALGSFINGLGEAEEKGSSAIELLDELGISEVRLRDALLRAGNASELFGNAIETSNEAFSQNTALTEEASKRYETTESKLKILRNQVTDTAIEFGGPFVDALRNSLTAAEPVIEVLGNLAQSFNEASPEMQETIVKTLAFTAAIGPASVILGKLISVGGGGLSVLGGLAKHFGVLSGTAKASSTALGLVGDGAEVASSSMVGATTKTAGLMKVIGGINPILGAAALAIGGGMVAWQLWGKEMNQNRDEISKWGTTVGSESSKALSDFQTNLTGMEVSMSSLSTGIEGNTEEVAGYVNGMVEEVAKANEKLKGNNAKLLEELPNQFKDAAEKKFAEEEKAADKSLENAEKSSNAIMNIYEKASKENRELSADESVFISNKQEEMQGAMLDNLGIYGEQRKTLEKTLGAQINELTANQAIERSRGIAKILDDEVSSYEKQQKAVVDTWGEGTAETKKHLSELENSHNSTTDAIVGNFVELMQQGDQSEKSIRIALGGMGIDYDGYKERVASNTKQVADYNGQLIQSTKEMTEENKVANELWNNLIWDEEKAEVKTNTKEAISEWVLGEKTWDNINLLAKDANLDTNAKKTLMEVLVENGKWDLMDWNSKAALIETNSAETAYKYLANHGQWESMTFKEKMAILNSNTPETVRQALIDKGVWDKMSPREQKLVMSSNAERTVSSSQSAVTNWNNNANPKTKTINVDTNAGTVASNAQRSINGVVGKTVTIRTVMEQVNTYQTIQKGPLGGPRLAKGTNFHIGGLATLGDGGNHEPYLTPKGEFGISPNTDTLFNLPRGTKVWPSISKFKAEVPKFAKGTNIADTKIMSTLSRMRSITADDGNGQSYAKNSERALESSSQTTRIEGDTYHLYLTAQGSLPRKVIREMAEQFQQEIKNVNDRKRMSRGEVVTP